MIRTKGEAGTGDIVNAVRHMRAVFGGIRRLGTLSPDELYAEAKNLQAPVELVRWVAENGRLPVVTFTAGGIATPSDAALCMQLGADGVFVGSGIFKSEDPSTMAKAIVEATTHFRDPGDPRARLRPGLGEPMRGLSAAGARARRAARDARLVAGGRAGGAAEAAPPRTQATYRIPRSSNAAADLRSQSRCRTAAAPRPRSSRARSGIVVPGKSNCPSRMIVSALTWPMLWRMSQSARDQIMPSWCTAPFRPAGYLRFVSVRRRQCGTVDV